MIYLYIFGWSAAASMALLSGVLYGMLAEGLGGRHPLARVTLGEKIAALLMLGCIWLVTFLALVGICDAIFL